MNDNETRPVPPIPPIEAETPETPTPEQSEAPPMPTLDELHQRVSKLEVETAADREVTKARFDALMSKEQIAQLIASTAGDMIDTAIREQWQPIHEAIARVETISNGITHVFADDQMRRNKFEKFVKHHIREINDRDQLRKEEYDDFKDRLGNWLIPMLGYNPNHASDTREPIVVPMIKRQQNTEQDVIEIKASVKTLADRAARQDAKEHERQEWLNKVLPDAIQKVIGSPAVIRAALALATLLSGLVGLEGFSQFISNLTPK